MRNHLQRKGMDDDKDMRIEGELRVRNVESNLFAWIRFPHLETSQIVEL